MTKDEFLRLFQEKLELEPRTLSGHESLKDTGFWDSLAAITFIALADEKFGVEVSGDQLAACATVDDLLHLLGTGLS